MLRTIATGAVLILLVTMHVIALGKTDEAWKALPQDESVTYVMPSPLMKITSLEFKGLMSDYLYLKSTVILGTYLGKGESRKLSAVQWDGIYRTLDIASDLDPYFVDPYYTGNTFLTWEAGKIEEANNLLEKGSRARTWDWILPFFSGFNYFYFLDESDKASEQLMEASRRPGASPILASIASRIAFKARRTENSIVFLEEILAKTEDESVKKQYKTRIQSLKNILFLEQAVASYKNQFRRDPSSLEALLNKHVIDALPRDPYGGVYYLDKEGQVKTTKEAMLIPYRLHH